MSNFVFETLGSQGVLFSAQDTLTFSNPQASAVNLRIDFGLLVTVTDLVDGVSKAFGSGFLGTQHVVLPDGSQVRVGTAGNDVLSLGAADGGLFGGPGDDTLTGGPGNDVLEGGSGVDVLTGGGGSDHFIFRTTDVDNNAFTPDVITDWNATDLISLDGPSGTAANFYEGSEGDLQTARLIAEAHFSLGKTYAAMQVGSDVLLFANNSTSIVELSGKSLADISFSNIVADGPVTPVPPPVSPPPPPPVSPPPTSAFAEPTFPPPPTTVHPEPIGDITGDMDLIQPGNLVGAYITEATGTAIDLRDTPDANATPHLQVVVIGTGFTYANNQLVGGTVTDVSYIVNSDTTNLLSFDVHVAGFPATLLSGWIANADAQGALSTILGGADELLGSSPPHFPGEVGGSGADLIRGFGGNDLIEGMGGPDTLYGGAGDDVIYATTQIPTDAVLPASPTYLRGEDGDDYIVGGPGFDDINGNQGNDTLAGGPGDDWVVGGKGDDFQFGNDGNDIVWGNLGNDTLDGGAGNDQVRGGQGDDLIYGGAGNDYISGDRGNDTEIGGTGADTFHSSSGAGIDRVLDFNQAEGDRVMLDPGTSYTVSQVGNDTVVDMGNGDKVILVGVTLSSLKDGWIFEG